MVLGDLAEFTHFVTRVKIVPAVADDVSLTETERTRGRAFAAKLSMRVLARTWQMLLKGIDEVAAAGRPIAAAEMVLVRIAYAADLPTPDEVIRSLGDASRGNGGALAAAERRQAADVTARAEFAARGSAARRHRGRRSAARGATPEIAGKRAGRARRRPRRHRARARELRGAGGARRREARSRRSRARSSATCGWCASRTAGSRSALEASAPQAR